MNSNNFYNPTINQRGGGWGAFFLFVAILVAWLHAIGVTVLVELDILTKGPIGYYKNKAGIWGMSIMYTLLAIGMYAQVALTLDRSGESKSWGGKGPFQLMFFAGCIFWVLWLLYMIQIIGKTDKSECVGDRAIIENRCELCPAGQEPTEDKSGCQVSEEARERLAEREARERAEREAREREARERAEREARERREREARERAEREARERAEAQTTPAVKEPKVVVKKP